jgi:hypothetical protein
VSSLGWSGVVSGAWRPVGAAPGADSGSDPEPAAGKSTPGPELKLGTVVSSFKSIVSSPKFAGIAPLDMLSPTDSTPDELRKVGGKSKISDRSLAHAFECNFEKGKTFSSKTTFVEI